MFDASYALAEFAKRRQQVLVAALLVVLLHPSHFAVLVHQHCGALRDANALVVQVVALGHGALGMEIREQWERELVGLSECFVRPSAVHADAEHLRAELVELRQIVAEASVLVGAGGAEIERVKSQYYGLAAKLAQLDLLARPAIGELVAG